MLAKVLNFFSFYSNYLFIDYEELSNLRFYYDNELQEIINFLEVANKICGRNNIYYYYFREYWTKSDNITIDLTAFLHFAVTENYKRDIIEEMEQYL